MPSYLQADRPLTITTPLGEGALLLIGLSGTESVSRLFHYQLDVLAENATPVPFEKLLGQLVTAHMTLPDGSRRHFNGICNRITQLGRDETFTRYALEVVPRLWLWAKRVQSRVFQQLSVPDILKKVLAGLDVAFQIAGRFHPRDYCVQYREPDLNFASRLMEEEGIFYYFKHADSSHQLVLGNTPGSHPDLPGRSPILLEEVVGGVRDEDRMSSWNKCQELRSGKYTLRDYCFEMPDKELEAVKTIQESVAVGQVTHYLKVGGNDQFGIEDVGEFAYKIDGVSPGAADRPADLNWLFEDNQRTVTIRMQEEATPGLVIHGSGNCRQLASGHKMTLGTQEIGLARGLGLDGPYVILSVTHSAQLSANYRSGSQEAGEAIELKVGNNIIRVDKEGVRINGMVIKITAEVLAQISALATMVEGMGALQMAGPSSPDSGSHDPTAGNSDGIAVDGSIGGGAPGARPPNDQQKDVVAMGPWATTGPDPPI